MVIKISEVNRSVSQNSRYWLNTKKKESTESMKPQFHNVKQLVVAGVGLGAIISSALIYKKIKINRTNAKMVQNTVMNAIESRFPNDIEYKKIMLKALGIPENRMDLLNSVVGPQEYKSLVQEFSGNPDAYTPGVSLITKNKDDYNLKGVINNTFRISLHNHTKKSDGQMSVAELLHQAARYADDVAQANKLKSNVLAPDAPFTIAITDHDTVEGCKEALKIISDNPEKFKNLRVVLGTELTLENKMLGNYLAKPVPVHMVVNCLNPFDKALNDFLEIPKLPRQNVAQKYLQDVILKLSDKQMTSNLDFEEAKELYPTIKEGLNYPWYYLKEYVISKAHPQKKIEVKTLLEDVKSKYVPRLEMQDYCVDMEKAMEFFQKQQYGEMTMAHPALTSIGESLKDQYKSNELMVELISQFKKTGKERAFAVEIYYPYYGDVGESSHWLEMIAKAASDNKLVATGGLDSHGKSIFYSAL